MRLAALFPLTLVALCFAGTYSPPTHAATIYGVAVEGSVQSLVTWNSAAPGTLLSNVPITGLPAGETIRGIDFDPFFATGFQRLIAIGAGSDQFANVYRIQVQSGFAGKLPQSASPRANANGEDYGVTSFDSGGIRSVSDANRLAGYSTTFNSGAGAGSLAYAPGDANVGATPHPVHRFNGYMVDTALDIFALNSGDGSPRPLPSIGPLGADFDDAGAIDAATENNDDTIFAALLPTGQTQSSFYTVNQQTGATSLIGSIGNGLLITAMAVQPPLRPVPEPRTFLLGIIALAYVVATRHKRANSSANHIN